MGECRREEVARQESSASDGNLARSGGETNRGLGVGVVELGGPPPDLTKAYRWRLVVTAGGIPVGTAELPSPGRDPHGLVLEQAAFELARDLADRRKLEQSLAGRLGVPHSPAPSVTVSVVVCTHRRRGQLSVLLAALEDLDPAPLEILVVDNDPGSEDCEAIAAHAGARYVREDRRGLNVARATGLAVARGDVVAFTDDDCEPPPGWLAPLPDAFDDPLVSAATGPAFPATLDTPSQLRFEDAASFVRGYQRRTYDWLTLSPADAVHAGAGANLAFRRADVDDPVALFPPELDAGTATRSGGDTYALYRVLRAGRRIVYDPALYTFHHHRVDPGALREGILGYGIGTGAWLAKIFTEERDLEALRAWAWLPRQWLWALSHRLRGEAADVPVAAAYLRGGLQGPFAWRRTLAGLDPAPGAAPPSARRTAPQRLALARPAAAKPAVSVVVPTVGRENLLAEVVRALADQEPRDLALELIVVDDSRGDERPPRLPPGLPTRTITTAGAGAAAARNAGAAAARGELLVFLDDDLIPDPDLLERHIAAHRRAPGPAVVVGYSAPRPRSRSLAARAATIWWEDHFRQKRMAGTLTFTDMLSGNMSIARGDFERVGGFEAAIGRGRREDWEFGLRAQDAGLELVYDAQARAEHHFSLSSRDRLDSARAEGAGDATLLARHPHVLGSLPAGRTTALGRRHRAAAALLRRPRPREGAARLLDVAERRGLWRAWASWFALTQRAAYESGFRSNGGLAVRSQATRPVVRVELHSEEPIRPTGGVAPTLELTVAGKPVVRVADPEGQWGPTLARMAAVAVPRRHLRRPGVEGALGATAGLLVLGFDEAAVAALDGSVAKEVIAERGGDRDRWMAADRAVRAASQPYVAIALPGVSLTAAWLRDATSALGADRLAAVAGAGLPHGEPPSRLELGTAETLRRPYESLGRPPQYLAVRRDHFLSLGGFAHDLAGLGAQGVVLDYLTRAVAAGFVIGQRDTAGIAPPGWIHPASRTDAWQRWRARGALTLRSARPLGRLGGAVWLAREGFAPLGWRLLDAAVRGQGSTRGAMGALAAFSLGIADGIRAIRPSG